MQSYVFFRNQTTFATILPQISLCLGGPPTDFTDLHRTSCWGYSPTEYAEFTELLAEDVLPQISQIYTDAANFKGVHPNNL